MGMHEDAIRRPLRLFGREEILAAPCPAPAARGAYGWWFRSIPPGVPTDGCETHDGLTLLYVGISPKNAASQENLKKRLTYHFRGNAEGSTLRLSLGVLLAGISDFPLRRVGSGTRMTFTHLGEQWLDAWLAQNAFVCWVEHDQPWKLEERLIKELSLPLNLQGNTEHIFHPRLSALWASAKAAARALPIASESTDGRTISSKPS